MVVLYITKDRESDLYLWQQDKQNIAPANSVKALDCSSDEDLRSLISSLTNISFFSQEEVIVAHNVPYSKELQELLETTNNTIYIVSGSGRWSSYKSASKTYTEPISDQKVKLEIIDVLKKQGIPQGSDLINKVYNAITVKTPAGKERLSPLLADTLKRQLLALDPNSPEFKTQCEYILESSHANINQWKVLDYLFITNKKEQFQYFSELTKTVSPFELIAQIKSMLFLLRVLVTAVSQGLDSKTIATKLKKHPFYISSLLQTAKAHGVTGDKIDKLVMRFMKLEHALKSGAFEDELFGFEILLATT